ncbi:MAG: LytTR family DNA-binding domain-containing protein [Blastocatellia bacterium]|nr:LytTR family DNA-binding domain-containing protein [Blastocatellia bacterium]
MAPFDRSQQILGNNFTLEVGSFVGNLIRAVIVDDERMARKMLRMLLLNHPEVEIVGEAQNAAQALQLIHEHRPEVVFLDIQMPGASGFDLLARIEVPVQVVFVTAFDEFALRAFTVNALHYLLKPVDPGQLAEAVKRIQQSQAATDSQEPLQVEGNDLRLRADDSLLVTLGTQHKLVKVNTILMISACRDYSTVKTTQGWEVLVRKSMSAWEECLADLRFARIHRSTIVNLDFVDRIEKLDNGNFQLFMQTEPQPLDISRRQAAQFRTKLR